MEIETRQAALCLIRHGNAFLVAEIQDPQSGVVLHRPPGGGVEEGETPVEAVRRELSEELGITLTAILEVGTVDHIWFWKGREVQERAWLFLATSSDDARLSRGECPWLIEADVGVLRQSGVRSKRTSHHFHPSAPPRSWNS